MNPTEELSLVSRLGRPEHQRQAFEELVRRYGPRLYRQIRRMVYDHDDTNDILQNTFVKAWSGLDSFRGDSRIGTWLYRIAANEALNFLQRRKATTGIDEAPQAVTARLAADPYFDGDETELLLQEAVASLPDKQAKRIYAHFILGMSKRAIARTEGVDEKVVRVAIERGLRNLEKFLKNFL